MAPVGLGRSLGLLIGYCLTIGSIAPLHAQVVTPPKQSDSDIVINPTMTECKSGWQDGEKKWSKEQFDKFCGVMQSPSPDLVNPTTAECDKGWNGTLRWTRQQFDLLCSSLGKSK